MNEHLSSVQFSGTITIQYWIVVILYYHIFSINVLLRVAKITSIVISL